jgi:hypothetical protein
MNRDPRGGTKVASRYLQLFAGVAVTAAGAVGILEADAIRSGALWWGGLVALLGGVTLVFSGIGAIDRPARGGPRFAKSARRVDAKSSHVAPRLGELAVHQAGLITQQQLAEALERQQEEQRPLGGVMVSMGLITPEQLGELLTIQGQRADSWGRGV